METNQKFLLGQLLIEKKIITQQQLEQALVKQRETGELLGVILLEMGFVDEEKVFLPIVAGQFGVDYVNLKSLDISPAIINRVPVRFASHYKMMPYDYKDGILYIATSHPLDVHLIDEISLVLNSPINPILASAKDILEAIRKYYGVGAETIDQMMGAVQTKEETVEEISQIEEIDSEASIGKFLNQILLQAYRDRATDIHIEPFEDALQIRYRVDGILNDAQVPKNLRHFKDSINSRIKILANLNIAEKRLPQDGRFKVRVNNIDLDLRVSFMPTPYGESVVMRLLNTGKLFKLDELSFNPDERRIVDHLLEKPHGIIFITGPTGSGKTTTLYSFLSKLNTEDSKIITIEDPVEYQLKGITQIQVNNKIGLTFAQGLRSMLRHDPDIMMVGEVRDIETAEIAIQSSLTGHLVFSTLHTNDAASGITRLVDMGVEPYLISSSVECFIAQRLLRTICTKCKEVAKFTPDKLKDFGVSDEEIAKITFYEGRGCEACNFTGMSGRDSIYEILVMNEAIRQLVVQRASASQIKELAIHSGMRTLRQAGWEKIKKGLTTPQEVMLVTQEEDNLS